MRRISTWSRPGCGVMLLILLAAGRPVRGGEPGAPLDPELARQARAAIDRGVDFLRTSQREDGGWRAFADSDPAITALVAKALAQHSACGPKHPVVLRAFDLILKHVQEDGGIYLPDSGLQNYYTSVAIMALSTSDEARCKAAVERARDYLVRLQWDEDEGYAPDHLFYGGAGYGREKRPDLSNTQMMLEALRQSGLNPEHPVYRKALVFINRCQMLPAVNDQPFAAGGDGGFIYSPANGGESKAESEEVDGRQRLRSYGSMTYAGFKSLLYARVERDDPRVRAAVDWIRKHYTLEHNPNMPGAKSHEGLYYYFHVFARTWQAWGQERITDAAGVAHSWRADLCRKLIALQRSDGSWINEADRWWEDNPYLVTAYAVLALQTALP